MKKIVFALVLSVLGTYSCWALSAREVLDKCAAVVSSADGLQAAFTMQSAQYGNSSGTIAVKGRKFHVTTPMATMWFDGTTQWTYLKKNEEVSVVNPTESQLQTLNPYNFINMYKQGYKYTMTTNTATHTVHLTATDGSRKIQEIFITIDKKNFHPSEIKILQSKKWTVFQLKDLKTVKLADAEFRFNSKDFPPAEVLALR